jgi:multiple sugar transport system permease protein
MVTPAPTKPSPSVNPTSRTPRAMAGTGGRTAALFLTPFFTIFALAMVAPVIYAMVLSFFAQQKSGLGFGEAKTVVRRAWRTTCRCSSPRRFVGGIARLALVLPALHPLHGGRRPGHSPSCMDATPWPSARKLFQLLVFLPHAVPGVIAALIWAYLYTPGVSPLVSGTPIAAGFQLNFLDSTTWSCRPS